MLLVASCMLLVGSWPLAVIYPLDGLGMVLGQLGGQKSGGPADLSLAMTAIRLALFDFHVCLAVFQLLRLHATRVWLDFEECEVNTCGRTFLLQRRPVLGAPLI